MQHTIDLHPYDIVAGLRISKLPPTMPGPVIIREYGRLFVYFKRVMLLLESLLSTFHLHLML